MKKRVLLAILSSAVLVVGCDGSETMTTDAAETENMLEMQTEIPLTEAYTEMITEKYEEEVIDFEYVLDNIAIFGDSVASGFGSYQKVDMSNVYATLGVGPSNIRDFSFAYGEDEFAALTVLSFEQPKYAVISMGLNDINTYSPERFSELYMEFVEDAMKVSDETDFYVFSVTPVSTECTTITNETIDEINAELCRTVEGYNSEKLHYFDCNSILKDESGNMNIDYSAGDGIHLCSSAYDLILEEFDKAVFAE